MRLRIILIGAALIGLGACQSGCATGDITELIQASDENPDCYKAVHATATPIILFGWVVPVIAGSYDKVCHADKVPEALRQGLKPGALVAPLGSPPAVQPSDPSPA